MKGKIFRIIELLYKNHNTFDSKHGCGMHLEKIIGLYFYSKIYKHLTAEILNNQMFANQKYKD